MRDLVAHHRGKLVVARLQALEQARVHRHLPARHAPGVHVAARKHVGLPFPAGRVGAKGSRLRDETLRDTPHPTHFSLDDALDWIDRLKPRRAVLTNLHTDMDYATLKARLPPGIDVAYDGMEIETAP